MKSDQSKGNMPTFSSEPIPSGQKPQTLRRRSTVPSLASMKSDQSKGNMPTFSSEPIPSGQKPQTHRPPSPVPSLASMKSDQSKGNMPTFSSEPIPSGQKPQTLRRRSTVPSLASMKSDQSKGNMPTFSSEPIPSGQKPQTHRPPSPVPSLVSMKSDQSKGNMPTFSSEPVPSGQKLSADLTQNQSRCGVCEQVLRDPVIITCGHSFCRQCISSYWEQPGLPGDQACPQCGKTCRTQPPLQPTLGEHTDISTQGEHTGLTNSRRHLHTEHTPGRKRELDEDLRSVIKNHKASLKRRFENISEGIIKPGAEILLNKIYTELYITEGESEGVNKEHEVWQVESASRSQSTEDTPINCNDIFKPLLGQKNHIKTVMTKGVAGIGKTVSVQKFILDWTDGVANHDVDFMFSLSFRELNLVRGDQYSLHRLLLDFHPELKELNDGEGYKDCQVVFIFDGLDESRLTLDLEQNNKLSDVKQTSSVDLLMTSLIQGTLLPSALIWITSRPAAASQIPAQFINQVTEVRGFNDPQKEEYFRKRITDESQANRIISHIKASRSLHIMCHIPVFCWITATVLQQMLGKKNIKDIPRTLTEMFIHFLLIQTTRKDQKYQSGTKANQEKLLGSQKKILLKLAELAFKNLENGNLMFYEEDLIKCGIDVNEASVYSGMCTEIFKEESVFHQKKVYCFVHLSVQEFLAAVFVFHSYLAKNFEALKSLITDEWRDDLKPSFLSSLQSVLGLKDNLHVLLKSAVDKALESQNGHMDLFLRFLMGISLERNHRLLRGLLTHTHNSSDSIKETCQYIKKLNREDLFPERCINLFHCLFEMNDHSMHNEIQTYLSSSKNINQDLSPAHCSALAHILLMSEEVLDEFDLKKYNTSDEGRRRLLPAVRCYRKAQLADCKLSEKSCGIVAAVLQSPNSLIELDLNQNDLGDSGVQLLSKGQSNPHCKLQILRLAECKLSEKSCGIVSTFLQSPNSLIELDLSYNDLADSGVQLLSKGFSSPYCKLQILRLSKCGISDEGYVCLALALMLNPSCVKELDVNNNHPGGSAQKLLSATLEDPHRKVEALQLAECTLTEKSFESVAAVLQSPNSLIELDLSQIDLGDSGVQLLSKGLSSLHCKLQTLRLDDCKLTDTLCEIVASVLQSPNSLLHLNFSNNDLGDSGVQLLSKGVFSPHCKLQTLRLAECKLSEKSCGIVAAVLQSPNSLLELDLSHNDLADSGVQLLSKGLSSPHCKLQILRLSKCGISDEDYVCLALALMLNPSCVKELDVNNNHSGGSAQKLLSATLEDPHRKVEALQLVECTLTEKTFESVATVLQSSNSLIELDLSQIDLGDSGVQLLSKGLSSPHCKLQTLRLDDCKLTDTLCEIVASVLQSPNSLLHLNFSNNDLGDSGVQLLSKGVFSPHCKLQTLRLAECKLSEKSCGIVAAILQSPNFLIELDLSHNDLRDSGVQLLSKGLSSPNCKLQTLRLSKCGISDEGYVCLALTLMINPSSVKELDVNNNHSGGSAQKLLSATLEDPHRKVEALQLVECTLTEKSFESVATVLQSPNSLIELDMSQIDLDDSGVQFLSKGLSSPHCKLQTLRLFDCKLTDQLCRTVASVLQSPNSLLHLNFSNNDLGDFGVHLLSKGLIRSNSILQILRLAGCKLTDKSCEIVASVLQSTNSLQQLDLSDNDLGDSGVQLLSKGLSRSNCKMHTLRLSDCLISEKGCGFLASALTSNPSHIKELDLSYNHPGELGLKRLSAIMDDPVCKLVILRTDHASVSRARPRLLRYACELTLDPNTAHRELSLSEGNRKVTRLSEKQPYPEHPERFDRWQVLCREGLSGRCYWEAEWSDRASIAVAYKSIKRKGEDYDIIMGWNAKSWCLNCSPDYSYSVCHNNKHTDIPAPSSCSRRVGVYLDWPAGTLSFYSVSSDTLTHLHTFHSSFTKPLCPGFYVNYGSSVSLCQVT
ncbi:uncharacterized protein LOC143136317 isoform X2 [Alosa pseudoharengus]